MSDYLKMGYSVLDLGLFLNLCSPFTSCPYSRPKLSNIAPAAGTALEITYHGCTLLQKDNSFKATMPPMPHDGALAPVFLRQ